MMELLREVLKGIIYMIIAIPVFAILILIAMALLSNG